MLRTTRILSASFVLALAACGGGTGPYGSSSQQQSPPPPPTDKTVSATPSLVFTPNPLTVTAGDIVTFTFGAVAHNVTFDSPGGATPADIPGTNSGVSFQRTFTTAGTYRFHCTIHPGMAGSVVVQ